MAEKCNNCGVPLIAGETERCSFCINPGDGVDSFGMRRRINELEKQREKTLYDYEKSVQLGYERGLRITTLEQRLETAETRMNKSQAALKELEMFHGGLINSYRACETERDRAESFSAEAKDALEAWDNFKALATVKLDTEEDARQLTEAARLTLQCLSDAPPLPDLAAARELAEGTIDTLEKFTSVKGFTYLIVLARRVLDSMKEKP